MERNCKGNWMFLIFAVRSASHRSLQIQYWPLSKWGEVGKQDEDKHEHTVAFPPVLRRCILMPLYLWRNDFYLGDDQTVSLFIRNWWFLLENHSCSHAVFQYYAWEESIIDAFTQIMNRKKRKKNQAEPFVCVCANKYVGKLPKFNLMNERKIGRTIERQRPLRLCILLTQIFALFLSLLCFVSIMFRVFGKNRSRSRV